MGYVFFNAPPPGPQAPAVPAAPTIASVTPGDSSAVVAFTGPAGGAIEYEVTEEVV